MVRINKKIVAAVGFNPTKKKPSVEYFRHV